MLFITKFCPKCNRSSDDVRFIGQFCEYCVIDQISSGIPKDIKVPKCRSCGRVKTNVGFIEFNSESLDNAIRYAMHMPEFDISLIEFDESTSIASIHFEKEVNNEPVGFERDIKIKFTNILCPLCSRERAGYFEAEIQLRGDFNKIAPVEKRILDFINKNGSFVSQIKESKLGVDLYIGSRDVANAFFEANKRLKPKRAYELHGIKGGVRVYRNIYSLHFD